ncbi:MAG: response regulator transcription factor [Epsilonproteobacteria bacterium]|nr:response regulator transcription factor [Campylobacterota bacterium]OIO16309.1 MAG: DNA-binding response regulator [Helicobacteraceae bacterium CG1_02_36_14]PIP09481.1 MAG: DNA-binding response regulator [Sulfurimonas sp. CG23_combo_of_CG06-09_8_20_14_all_36_33]PIS26818.1 MAG: DNA-binding response regulator [Sulfurimonas sp. CG08_land_8_20_14_0_20_36_33]PIU34164.1 MAG: DNA-binding response regulator [Sulfurimonas sp. CG07_land_8_20_14_0_80_36_56]PIV05247.1 MAG: DNA-binding response regulato
MKILIVDDEALARARLLRMLNTLGLDDVTEVSSADEAIQALKASKFDLAFLDINMPQVSGLELGYELRYIDANVAIVFQTAYDEHALKAFDIGAVGYLVKPYSIEQLKQVVERLNTPKAKEEELRIMSKNGENYLLLKPQEIYYVKADLSEVMLRSAKGFSYYAQKISDIEKKLEAYNFVKIHRSYLINIDEIKHIETIEQSKLRFSFKNSADQIESSKDGAKAFREKFSV